MYFFVVHCSNGSSQIQCIYFDKSYIPVAHPDSFIINISVSDIHILTTSMLDISSSFQNTNVAINEIVCVVPPLYYMDWFQKSYPNSPLNRYYGPFCPQFMNGIKGTKPAGIQWNYLLGEMVTILKYNNITIDHAIYIKVFSD